MNRIAASCIIASVLIVAPSIGARRVALGQTSQPTKLRFDVTLATSVADASIGRLLIALNPRAFPEPRRLLGHTAMSAPPVLGRDAEGLGVGRTYMLDRTSAFY